ncbi:hypothetical protein EVAR_572_1 [Eumeta japonica]|uniref:Uncharacterized protein n=1 Tax=Eumeta variegata TaxID=151549 RepID=A0A4C1SDQ5_EUMVA|nr:hypothetical protein EVAR_572_1 [Eumeta japonica]
MIICRPRRGGGGARGGRGPRGACRRLGMPGILAQTKWAQKISSTLSTQRTRQSRVGVDEGVRGKTCNLSRATAKSRPVALADLDKRKFSRRYNGEVQTRTCEVLVRGELLVPVKSDRGDESIFCTRLRCGRSAQLCVSKIAHNGAHSGRPPRPKDVGADRIVMTPH